jgi:FdhD protein
LAPATKNYPVVRIKGASRSVKRDTVVKEGQLTILLNGQKIVTLACTPKEQNYLALGFLFSEGIIKGREEIKRVLSYPEREEVRVFTKREVKLSRDFFQTSVLTSGRGKGKSFKSLEKVDPLEGILLNFEFHLTPSEILSLMSKFDTKSTLFKKTGGVHGAALADNKRILIFAEDIGRHNALDKVLGKALMKRIILKDKLILSSGRISSDLLLKVWRANLSFICSRSAPTGKALDLAKNLGVTVVGFARGRRMNVYTYPARIATSE